MTKRIRSFLRPAVGHRFLQTWTCIFWYTLWLYVSHSRYTLNLSHCGNVSTLSTLRNVSAANRENENQALKRVPTIKLSFTAGQKEKELEESTEFSKQIHTRIIIFPFTEKTTFHILDPKNFRYNLLSYTQEIFYHWKKSRSMHTRRSIDKIDFQNADGN